jgi:hypothetical protein
MDIGLILATKYSDRLWTLVGDDYSGLEWKDSSPKPTESEIHSHWPEVEMSTSNSKIDELRRVEYQRVSDPLFFSYQRGEATEQEWLDAVQAVKDKYPRPYSANSQE